MDFSRPYAEHVRVAVVRCDEQARYTTQRGINRPGVRIAVRAAGSTAAFVYEHYPQADIEEVADLGLAFRRLIAGDGDVIIAPDFQQRRHRELCVALNGATFYRTPIAVLFPKGSPLVDPVNAWLDQRLTDGTVATLLRHYGFH